MSNDLKVTVEKLAHGTVRPGDRMIARASFRVQWPGGSFILKGETTYPPPYRANQEVAELVWDAISPNFRKVADELGRVEPDWESLDRIAVTTGSF